MQGWTCSNSLCDQGNHLQASLDDDNPISTPLNGTTSSSMSVFMNSLNLVDREKNRIKNLVTLHKQVKFWSTQLNYDGINYSRKYIPWVSFCCKQWRSSQL